MKRSNVVLAYHAIGKCRPEDDHDGLFVDPEAFEAQMAHLARTGRARSLDEVVEQPGRGHVAVTFDDGYRNVLELAAPSLQLHGIPATVFVPTGHLGRTNSWVQKTPCDLAIMDVQELAACS